MHTIYDHQLYTELKKDLSWKTLFDNEYCFKNPNIPEFFGGLDHVSKTKKYFTFHDIGCNGRDNSFRIGDQPLYVVCFSDDAFFGTPYHLYTEEDVRRDALRPSLALDEEDFLKLYNTGKYRFVTLVSRSYGVEEETLDEIMSIRNHTHAGNVAGKPTGSTSPAPFPKSSMPLSITIADAKKKEYQ